VGPRGGEKLSSAGFDERPTIMIYDFDYDDWPMDPVIDSFETPDGRRVTLATERRQTSTGSSTGLTGRVRVFRWGRFERTYSRRTFPDAAWLLGRSPLL
jgi:hypothetical protein